MCTVPMCCVCCVVHFLLYCSTTQYKPQNAPCSLCKECGCSGPRCQVHLRLLCAVMRAAVALQWCCVWLGVFVLGVIAQPDCSPSQHDLQLLAAEKGVELSKYHFSARAVRPHCAAASSLGPVCC